MADRPAPHHDGARDARSRRPIRFADEPRRADAPKRKTMAGTPTVSVNSSRAPGPVRGSCHVTPFYTSSLPESQVGLHPLVVGEPSSSWVEVCVCTMTARMSIMWTEGASPILWEHSVSLFCWPSRARSVCGHVHLGMCQAGWLGEQCRTPIRCIRIDSRLERFTAGSLAVWSSPLGRGAA